MFLTSANTLSAILAVAVNTTAPDVLVDFADLATNTYTPANQVATLSSSPTTILAAPASGAIRQVKYINIHNSDDIDHTFTVTLTPSVTLVSRTISPGRGLSWSVETGWLEVSPLEGLTFDDLTDTPSSKVGEALKIVRVNAGETDLEYADHNPFDQSLDTTDVVEFTGIQLGGSGPANLFDDYEEGTYDVTVICSTSGTVTLSSSKNKASFTKVAGVVTVGGQVDVSAISSPLGFLTISLPFVIDSSTENEFRTVGPLLLAVLSSSVNVPLLRATEGTSTAKVLDIDGVTDATNLVCGKIQVGTAIVFSLAFVPA